ncbi:glycoside hydrolase family 43 protein [Polyplosphaeria fusca]|uniref:Glycoside hydrolase family 43 protein n=1 Tax=Polyplosphaeria fusca TaxID=682080 RepID=A0A9P4R7P5_9PLEO|nr:glycoside hydrolase family 43 protein [Polyplosphaeria fusca]
MKLISLLLHLAVCAFAQNSSQPNATFTNPVLPGWHSDPSCTHVNSTFFCVTSTFEAFPGLPVYASKDLRNWKLVSHVWNREAQLPGVSWNTTQQQQGMYAATIRHHEGEIFVVCEYLGLPGGIIGVLFRTSDPFDEDAWSDPLIFHPDKIDPDLFWENGTLYVATQGIVLQKLDMKTGELSKPTSLWNGTGGVWPEGPHLYKRDGYYYLMIAEGGTAEDHSITIARSRQLYGPYEAYEHNPILTNRNTQRYFQTVGHGDLFQDEEGAWWGMCLATRSGPAFEIYPMGREAVLFPATWEKGQWPVLQTIEGRMNGWPSLPTKNRDVPGDGPFNSDPDAYDFEAGSKMPKNLIHWRVPREGAFKIGSEGLEVTPSRTNLTGIPFGPVELSGQRGISFIGRRQTDTLFAFSVDLQSKPQQPNHEAGVTVFLTQVNHIDLGVVYLPAANATGGQLVFRFRVESQNVPIPVPETKIVPVPADWKASALRLEISTSNNVTYEFSASPVEKPEAAINIGTASAQLVSAGNGTFVGSLVGAYATCNGAGEGLDCPKEERVVFKRWRYTGKGQQIADAEIIQ